MSVCADRFGGLNVAFNFAGASRGGPIVNHSIQDWDLGVDLCLKGVLLSLKHEGGQMRSSGGGAIVNVSSVCAHFPVYGGPLIARQSRLSRC